MHNTNRDHLSARASNVEADRSERDLFRALILLDRYRLCADRAVHERERLAYRELAEQQIVAARRAQTEIEG